MIHADRRTRNLAWLPPQRPPSSIRKPSVYPGITQTKRSETGPVACELPAPADSLWRLIALTVFGRRGPGLLEARHDEQAANLLAAVMEHPEKAAKTA